MSPAQIKKISENIDIGGHSYHHIDLTSIPPTAAEREIIQGKSRLEEIIDRDLTLFCYPKGKLNSGVVDAVKKAGFKGARTTRFFDAEMNDPYRFGTTICAYDHIFPYYMKQFIRTKDFGLLRFLTPKIARQIANNFIDWTKIAMLALDYTVETGGVWHLWGHSWQIENNKGWMRLEQVLKYIQEIAETHTLTLLDNTQLFKTTINDWSDRGFFP
jgi:peptidoglycan-N-acetylglucosamine deacetylase